jgi:hypothetical protein
MFKSYMQFLELHIWTPITEHRGYKGAFGTEIPEEIPEVVLGLFGDQGILNESFDITTAIKALGVILTGLIS